VNRRKVGLLGYDMIARYGLNDMHCILVLGGVDGVVGSHS